MFCTTCGGLSSTRIITLFRNHVDAPAFETRLPHLRTSGTRSNFRRKLEVHCYSRTATDIEDTEGAAAVSAKFVLSSSSPIKCVTAPDIYMQIWSCEVRIVQEGEILFTRSVFRSSLCASNTYESTEYRAFHTASTFHERATLKANFCYEKRIWSTCPQYY